MGQTQVVFFSIDQGEYAMNIEYVEKIIGYSEMTHLPETSDYVLGLLAYQEKVLPIIDLNKRFYNNFLEYDEESKILVISLKEYKIGLVVDEVKGVQTIDDKIIERTSKIINGILPEYIKGMIKTEDGIVILLEAEKLFKGNKKVEILETIQDH